MLSIYLSKKNPRNRYIFKLVFSHYFDLQDYQLIYDREEFLAASGPKFSYSPKPLADELHFHASGLLEERGIRDLQHKSGSYQGTPTLFMHDSKSAMTFDPFAASFFMLSRYEEYLPHRRDQYDRFIAEDSIAVQKGFLQTAVVDRWLLHLKQILKEHFPELKLQSRKYEYILTLDIDNAFAYKAKGMLRNLGAAIRNLSKGDLNTIAKQFKVLLKREMDPFDSYNYLMNIQKRYHLRPIYFFLLADYGLNDKNISHQSRSFQSLIKSIADYADIGIHPSFGSNYKKEKLHSEILRLERITKREVYRSRQHFLKLHLPDTYRHLVEEDIQEDYTMGYASALGFRAGASFPFPFYDLDEEVELKLKVYPFMVMDATLKYYLKTEGEEALEQIKRIIDEVKEVNGTFISLWHNESLGTSKDWGGWRELFEKMNEYAISQ